MLTSCAQAWKTVLFVMLTCWIAGGRLTFASATQPSDQLQATLDLLPANVDAAIIVSNLKKMSDQLVQCLEGMDRANLLLGSRPIDQLKSASGLSIGVNDLGSLIIYFSHDEQNRMTSAALVPVTDADSFLKGNFPDSDGGSYTLSNGISLHAKKSTSHVVLSQSAQIAAAYEAAPGSHRTLLDAMGKRGEAIIDTGEIIAFAHPNAIEFISKFFKAQAADRGVALPDAAVGAGGGEGGEGERVLLDHLRIGVMSIDFDPLGVIVRSLGRMSDDQPQSILFAGGNNGGQHGTMGLTSLPNKPFYFALSIDAQGLGGQQAMQDLCGLIGFPAPPKWLSQSQSLQCAAYPSPAGLTGGLLNDALAVLHTSRPAEAKAFLKKHITEPPASREGITVRTKWQDAKAIKEGLIADAYEVTVADVPPAFAQQQIAYQLMFGRAGWRGFVADTHDAVVMTFSQRPAVIEAGLTATAAAKGNPKSGLASYPAIHVMRSWMPPQTDFELYIGVGQLGQLVNQVADSLGGGELMKNQMLKLDPSLPPVGFGMDIGNQNIETATIIPAGVASFMLDAMMKQASPVSP